MIFTDESSFQNFRNTIKLWGKKRYLKMKSKTRKQIMVWGGISLRGTTPLKHVFGSINSDKYIEILNECLIPTCETLYPDGWFLIQDNAPCHKSAKTMEWLREQGIQLIDWPPGSPDLNPIEEIWQVMKRRLEEEMGLNSEMTVRKIMEIWENIMHETLKTFIESMKHRIEQCIKLRGDTIR